MIISLTLHSSYLQFKFCSSVIYFIKRSRNFGFAGQCFMSSFLLLICNFTSCLNMAFFRGIYFFFIIRVYEVFTRFLFSLFLIYENYRTRRAIQLETAIKHSPVDLSSLIWHSRIQFTFFCNTHVYIFVRIYLNISISRRKYT